MKGHKIIKNKWAIEDGCPYRKAVILDHRIHPEGLDVDRIRFITPGYLELNPKVGHIVSVMSGSGVLHLTEGNPSRLLLCKGLHFYLPPELFGSIEAESGADFVKVSSPTPSQAPGSKLIFRDETFVFACASSLQSLRWILTPQYLSRRIFLHHDPVLLSKTGNPVSWFHTTMFDVNGLPQNEDGESVFKMSYNSRTEVNFCYDTKGTTRVRMAKHPYREQKQLWGPWQQIDNDTTYHLNEEANGPEEEHLVDETTKTPYSLRNKHEVYIKDGHVSLFCLFDPAPAGIERHQPGDYSDYEPLSKVIETNLYKDFKKEIKRFDQMVDTFSIGKATGELSTYEGTKLWDLYQQGRRTQLNFEEKLVNELINEGNGREKIIANWLQNEILPNHH